MKIGRSNLLLDTFAWVEFFRGTKKGEVVKKLLEEKSCFTSAISIAELSEWIERKELDRKKTLQTVKRYSGIISADLETLELSGILKVEKRKKEKGIGLVDCIILATAMRYNLKVVTGDPHFKDENALLL